MTKLSKTQKEHLVLTSLMTGVLALVLWHLVITPARKALETNETLLRDWQQAQREGKSQADLLAKLNQEYEILSAEIRQAETTIASGDPYRWLMKSLPSLSEAEPVDILNYEPPEASEWQIFPRVPYRAATFTVSGAGYYQDLGKLLVAIENTYPWIRIRRLELEPKHSAEPDSAEDEKLNFRLEFVSMHKTNSIPDSDAIRRLTSKQ
jgi:hypothetical protein